MFPAIVAFLSPHFDTESKRQALLHTAFSDQQPLLARINYDGAASEFVPRLVRILQQHGEIRPNTQSLWQLLLTLRQQVGIDKQQEIDLFEPWANQPHTVTLLSGDLAEHLRGRICPPLPDNPVVFGGRDHELEKLIAKLEAGKATAITAALHGLSGIGKTILAKRLAHELHRRRNFRAVIWTEVNQTPNVRALLTTWARYGDSSFQDDPTQPIPSLISLAKAHLTQALEVCPTCDTSRVLVILDDIWADDVPTVRHLISAIPDGATLLITTRFASVAEDLKIKGEVLGYLAETEYANFFHAYEALAGLDEALLTQLGAALGGYPLALDLAARRVIREAQRPKQTFTTALQNSIQAYQEGIPAGASFQNLKLEQGEQKEDNLTVSLSFSYAALSDAEQARFRALGVLAPTTGFDQALSAALWDIPLEQVDDAADGLRALGLLETDSDGYRQHPLLRAYARALLEKENVLETAFHPYADFIIQQCEQFRTLPPEDWNAKLTPYYPHILYMGDTLVAQTQTGTTGDVDRAQAFAYNITRYLARRREVQRLAWLEMGLNSARQLQTGAAEQVQTYHKRESLFLNELALAWSALGEKRRALDFYEQALPLDRAVGDRGGEATTLNNIGKVWDDLGEKRRALDFYEQALPLRRAVGDRGGEAATLNNIGLAWDALGAARPALNFYEQALPLRRAVGDRGGEATTLNNIGSAWSALGEKRQALDFFEQALPLYRAVGDRGGEATTLNNISYLYFQNGELEKTIEIQQQIIKIVHEMGAVAEEASFLLNIAVVYQRMGRIAEAIQSAEAGRAILVSRNLPQNAGGSRIADYDAFLAQLRGSEAQPTPNASNTLPREVIETWAKNTYAVMTQVAEKRDEWRGNLQQIHADFSQRGADWVIEVAFVGALLEILDSKTPTLPEDNPYAAVVRQINEAIAQYKP